MGKASYCFYSFQTLLLFLAMHAIGHLGTPPLVPYTLGMLGLLIAVSFAGYYLIEEPARRFI